MSMSHLLQLFATIESPEFAANLTIASDLRTFLRAAEDQPEFADLARLAAHPGADLLGRIREVVSREFDEKYQNPWDAAVAVYLWLLSKTALEQARTGAAEIVKTRPDFWWWASAMADQIIGPGGTRASTVESSTNLGTAVPPNPGPTQSVSPNLPSAR